MADDPPPPPEDRPPVPPEDGPPPAPVGDPVGGDCPRCGTPYGPGQEYCLECGLRLPVTRPGIVGRVSTVWRRRAPYPGDWWWPVLLGLLVAGLATAAVILLTRDDGGDRPTLVATPETGTGAVDTSTTAAGDTSTIAPPPEPTTTAPAPAETTESAPASTTLTTWPAGTNGFTVVLKSIPTSAGRGVAVKEARKALAGGLADVGVLDSSDYSSLHAGYFVVFSGVYTTQAEATNALGTARSGGYSDAYASAIAS